MEDRRRRIAHAAASRQRTNLIEAALEAERQAAKEALEERRQAIIRAEEERREAEVRAEAAKREAELEVRRAQRNVEINELKRHKIAEAAASRLISKNNIHQYTNPERFYRYDVRGTQKMVKDEIIFGVQQSVNPPQSVKSETHAARDDGIQGQEHLESDSKKASSEVDKERALVLDPLKNTKKTPSKALQTVMDSVRTTVDKAQEELMGLIEAQVVVENRQLETHREVMSPELIEDKKKAEIAVEELPVALEVTVETGQEDVISCQQSATITSEEYELAKSKLLHDPRLFHFAIVGSTGCGKSSLVNAFRGLGNKSRSSAPVELKERHNEVGRYPDPNPKQSVIWYDIPGIESDPDGSYFKTQKLFAFDCIIVCIGYRLNLTDTAILKDCNNFGIPSFVVRSKSDQHISNIIKEMNSRARDPTEVAAEARAQYIETTREYVNNHLESAGLQDKVFLVSRDVVRICITHGQSSDVIDEELLIINMFDLIAKRRLGVDTSSQ